MPIDQFSGLFQGQPISNFIEAINELLDPPTNKNLQILEQLLTTLPKLPQDSFPFAETSKVIGNCMTSYEYITYIFLAFGQDGLTRLFDIFMINSYSPDREDTLIKHINYHILFRIYSASTQKNIDISHVFPGQKVLNISEKMQFTAKELLREIIIESQREIGILNNLLSLASFPNSNERRKIIDIIFDTIRESSINVSKKIIQDFKKLIIHEDNREEEYQKFLTKNPILLDPLAKKVISKQKLGKELITDFVIERLDGDYIIVEIEKPSDSIFNQNDDFSSKVFHAYGQILDFQEWIESNIAYAQKIMPDIIAPKGLLIIGRRSKLTEKQIQKLKRFNINNNGRVQVLCFDDIVTNATRLYENIHHKKD